MTRARALKHAIRARAAKTGERYTTARRHVLNELQPIPAPAVPRRPATVARAAASSKGVISDALALEKTGHGLDYWFGVLDRFAAIDKGHTATARHLFDAHRLPGWYAQGITLAYERARGVRTVNQRYDGEYEVSVSKVVAAGTMDVVQAFAKARRRRWIGGVDADLAGALAAALDSPPAKGIIVRPDGLGRFRYKWDGTTVQFYLVPKPGGKVSIVVTHSHLAGTAAVEQRRQQWRTALGAIAVFLAT